MPLGAVARCWRCKGYFSGEELELNRDDWEYYCKNFDRCISQINKGAWIGHCSGFVSNKWRKRATK